VLVLTLLYSTFPSSRVEHVFVNCLGDGSKEEKKRIRFSSLVFLQSSEDKQISVNPKFLLGLQSWIGHNPERDTKKGWSKEEKKEKE